MLSFKSAFGTQSFIILTISEGDFDLFLNKYVSDSKEPAQFISCFNAYFEFIKKNREIKIPILFDASCSGMQHLSALTSDLELAKLTNILLLKSNGPADFYQFCIELIKENIGKMKDSELKKKLLGLDISRK